MAERTEDEVVGILAMADEMDDSEREVWLIALLRERDARVRREAFEEAARVVEDCEVAEAKGDTYYAQLGDASATLDAAAAELRALAAREKEQGNG